MFISTKTIGQSTVKDSNDEMVLILSNIQKKYSIKDNAFLPYREKYIVAEIAYYDSLAKHAHNNSDSMQANTQKAFLLLSIGKEQEAVEIYEDIKAKTSPFDQNYIALLRNLAIAYMRLGERQNCVTNHSNESCIMPIIGKGVHKNKQGSSKAIELYEEILRIDSADYESMWVLNIAYMTLGKFPNDVPKYWLISNLNKNDSIYAVKSFTDIASNIGFNYRNCAGGLVVEDLNNDGYLDIVTSGWNVSDSMHYLLNNGKGKFEDISIQSNLSKFKGGALNMIHADYDNDGDNDILVLRGGWMDYMGEQPNSLLRNNGDKTFTDVTIQSGIYSEMPTQTAVWRDFNNDGWLDLFIGNETTNKEYPCELYISNKNGTFTEVAQKAKCDIKNFVKGVSAADFDHDGFQDIVISSFEGRFLLKNMGLDSNNIPQFENITLTSGLGDIMNTPTFSVWFWDYDNDGWQDIFVGGYQPERTLAYSSATDALGIANNSTKLYLYHNNKNGTFTNVSEKARLNKSIFPMGANFGDIDNDGYLDMYLGTGNPGFSSLAPNKLFLNMGEGTFADVTVSARVGNLQKGHAVAISDIDNDGDGDIIAEIGGAYSGDAFTNSLYLNPGQNNNNWIVILLEGRETNRSAIGTQIKVTFRENGIIRSVYREVNTGGSFGSATLRREIGIGSATVIDEIEITWAKTGKKQVFKNIIANQFIKITEENNIIEKLNNKKVEFKEQNLNQPNHHCEH